MASPPHKYQELYPKKRAVMRVRREDWGRRSMREGCEGHLKENLEQRGGWAKRSRRAQQESLQNRITKLFIPAAVAYERGQGDPDQAFS